MVSSRVVALALLGLSPLCSAQDAGGGMMGIPSCAIDCTIRALPETTCSPLNQTCLCADTKFNEAVAPCIIASCTVKEALALANASISACGHPRTDQRPVIHWVSGIATVISTVFVGLRLASRAAKLGIWGHDDTAVMLAFAFDMGLYVVINLLAKAGLGQDIWSLSSWQWSEFLKLLLVIEVLYVPAIAIAKSSILFFYCRIFPDKRFRRAVWAVQVFNALLTLAFLIVFVSQCQPFSYFWDQWDGEHKGKCIDFSAAALAHLGLHVVIDVTILVLPITQVYKLQMTAKRKAGVMAMFLTGIFVTIVTCLRIQGLALKSKWSNVTVATLGMIILTHVEVSVCIAVACMPNAWQLFKIFSSHVAKMSTTFGMTKKGSLASNNRASAGGRELDDRPLKSPATESTAFPEDSMHSPFRV